MEPPKPWTRLHRNVTGYPAASSPGRLAGDFTVVEEPAWSGTALQLRFDVRVLLPVESGLAVEFMRALHPVLERYVSALALGGYTEALERVAASAAIALLRTPEGDDSG